MSILEPLANDYNYYPRTMISLCTISYDDLSTIPKKVQQLGWEVARGPAELVSWLDVFYSLAYVCRRQQPNTPTEYTVVIRGTNMMSWDSWEKEDFAIGTTRPFNELAPHAPANALISHGTYRGTVDNFWVLQAMHQHHTATYQTLVNQAYPEALASSA